MRSMKRSTERAVSPVVGVMLMLVVTIVIAAVVSAFAGAMNADAKKVPQMTMKAGYSQAQGMTITHQGGDTINTLTTKFVVTPTADFGSYDQLSWTINSSAITIAKIGTDRMWNDPATYTSSLARTFQAGEVAMISANDLSQVQPRTYASSGTDSSGRLTDSTSSYYGFLNVGNLGQRFNLILVDDNGKTIAKTEVTIKP